MNNSSPKNKPPQALQQALDIIPLIAFFLAYWYKDLITATAVLIITSLLSLALSLLKQWHIPKKNLFGTAFIAFFGGLTLLFDNELFIKIKATISFSLAGIVFLVALYGFKKNFFHMMLKDNIQLSPHQWHTLARDTALFFFALAAANETVRTTLSTNHWVLFKVAGIPISLTLFLATSLGLRLFKNKHNPTQETPLPHGSNSQAPKSPPPEDS